MCNRFFETDVIREKSFGADLNSSKFCLSSVENFVLGMFVDQFESGLQVGLKIRGRGRKRTNASLLETGVEGDHPQTPLYS